MALDRNHWRTASLYVGSVVLVNVGFSLSPQLDWLWSLGVGGVLVLRDLAQRSWGHRTLALMLVAAWLPDTSPRPLATERVSSHWVGR